MQCNCTSSKIIEIDEVYEQINRPPVVKESDIIRLHWLLYVARLHEDTPV